MNPARLERQLLPGNLVHLEVPANPGYPGCPEGLLRDGKRAVELATDLCEQTNWMNYDYLGLLAAAYAEIGDFRAAVKWGGNAIELLPEETDPEARVRIQKRLEQYRLCKPYRFNLETTEFDLAVEFIQSQPQLEAHDARIEELNKAVDSNDLNKVKELLDGGADVNAKDVLGMAPLHIATQNGYKEMMELLVSHDAEINIGTRKDETPLHIAAQKNYIASVEFLLAKGAEIDARDTIGQLP